MEPRKEYSISTVSFLGGKERLLSILKNNPTRSFKDVVERVSKQAHTYEHGEGHRREGSASQSHSLLITETDVGFNSTSLRS